VNMTELGHALTRLEGPPVKAIVVYNSNPAAIAPNQNDVLAGFRREDLFTVVLEQFQNDTADYADILLPATTFLEHTDLYAAYGHYYLQLARPALPAPGEAKSNVEVFRALAERMGFDDPCFRESEDDMIRTLLDSAHPFVNGITLEELDREKSVRLRIAEPAKRRSRTEPCPQRKPAPAAVFHPRFWLKLRPKHRGGGVPVMDLPLDGARQIVELAPRNDDQIGSRQCRRGLAQPPERKYLAAA